MNATLVHVSPVQRAARTHTRSIRETVGMFGSETGLKSPDGTHATICHEVEARGKNRWKLSKEGFCPFHQSLVQLVRDNLEAAKVCGRKPPRRPLVFSEGCDPRHIVQRDNQGTL
jgi:hypothetical protein